MQIYPKTPHRRQCHSFRGITSTMHFSRVKLLKNFFLQLCGRSKVRLGFSSTEGAQQWFDAVRFDLDDQGVLSKDERRNKRMSHIVDGCDREGSVCSTSSPVSGSSGQSQLDHDIMVLYGVPVGMADDHLVEAFKTKNKTPTSVGRLYGTMGDISLAACKLVGLNLNELNGSIIRDPRRKKPMYMVTMNHYIEERASHTRQVHNRPRPQAPQKQSNTNTKWAVMYMQAVKGSPTK